MTCSLPAGERTGIIGENGSGKSTLLRLRGGHDADARLERALHGLGGWRGAHLGLRTPAPSAART
ncbi:ATP-binding cassette domain-containing protein [Streptomyces liangshanensis]|uniref:ATP-binding cassette domain-containing protein n=1 Tax=Streptomyces liangshanensis TaxID=2717324 RepID=UPI003C7E999D